MKQIFDWLREQIENKSNYEPVDYDYCDMACSGEQGFIAREDALDAINEAEAKWEAECCEWHFAKGGYYKTVIASPHKEFISLNTSDLKSQPYCGHCGKPIKIAEVE